MQFHPAQDIIASDPHRFRVARCGRRFGKSWLSAYEMYALALAGCQCLACQAERDPTHSARIVYYAPTRDDARDIMWKVMKQVCAQSIVGDPNESRLEINVKAMDGTISLIVLNGWEALQERGKGVGVKNNFAVLDEVSKYTNFDYGWQEILRPTLIDVQGGTLFISTTNGFNHFYDLCNKELTDSDYKTFHFTSYDNPHIQVEEIEKIKMEMTEDRQAQEIYAEFRKKEGLVYKEFSRERHIVSADDKPDAILETLGGVDAGFTHPTAVPTIKKDYEGTYWITDEWMETQRTEAEVVEYVASQRFNKVYPDPENASLVEALKRRGVNVRHVNKGKGSIIAGINTVHELLKQGKIKILPHCVNTIQGFEMYSYKESKSKATPDEMPSHEYSDMMDAIRYILMMDASSTYSSGPKVHFSNNKHYGQVQTIPKFNA